MTYSCPSSGDLVANLSFLCNSPEGERKKVGIWPRATDHESRQLFCNRGAEPTLLGHRLTSAVDPEPKFELAHLFLHRTHNDRRDDAERFQSSLRRTT
jgi:hypothetical protein